MKLYIKSMEQKKKRGKRGKYKPKPSHWQARSSAYIAQCLEKLKSGIHGTKCIEIPELKTNHDGYVRLNTRNGGRMLHRLVWESVNGPVPDGYEIHHKCGNRACQNLTHLECIHGSEHATLTNKEREFCIGAWKKRKKRKLETNTYPYNIYLVTVLYDVPQGGNIRVAAESAEKAEELIRQQFGSHKNLQIPQIIAEKDITPTTFYNTENAPVLEQSHSDPSDDDETPPSQRLH